jgi:uncharacterized membrane protein
LIKSVRRPFAPIGKAFSNKTKRELVNEELEKLAKQELEETEDDVICDYEDLDRASDDI